MHFQHWSLLGLLTFAIQHVAAVPLPPPGLQCCADCVCESNVAINSRPRVTARAPRNRFCLHAPGISSDCSEDVSGFVRKRSLLSISPDHTSSPIAPTECAGTSPRQRITDTLSSRFKPATQGCTSPPTKRTLTPITLPASLTNPNTPSHAPLKHQPRTDPELLANQTLTAMEAYIERAIAAGTFKDMTQTTHKYGSVTFRVQIATQEMVFEMPALWPPVQAGVLRRRDSGG
ncbi:hypothetical protein B9Z65_5428 [Elsinoe australis]|uniref:Uncharacterized protein n=1 Tax=Elsinoe australis TaxID=40998 RepID=A0A2P7ZE28_9PEZI|nr:hypothetical protein B9Z65_5428 [Elsinoe australis]